MPYRDPAIRRERRQDYIKRPVREVVSRQRTSEYSPHPNRWLLVLDCGDIVYRVKNASFIKCAACQEKLRFRRILLNSHPERSRSSSHG